MSIEPPRHRRAVALLLALGVSIPAASGAAGVAGAAPWLPVEEQPVADAPAEAPAFPGVPGVDLDALGYRGIPLDAAELERVSGELPDDAYERVAEIANRLELLPPLQEALAEAREVLHTATAELDPQVGQLRAALSVAEERATEASHRATEAERRLRARAAALAAHREAMAEVAVAAYVSPPDADVLAAVLGGQATTSADLTAGVLFTAKADHDGDLRHELELAVALAAERQQQTAAAAQQASRRATEVGTALADVQMRRDAHRQARDVVDASLVAVEELVPALREQLEETIAQTWGAAADLAAMGVEDVPVVSVEGIRIHAAIAPHLQALLAAAHSDGVPLGGWGYRSVEQQIMLRRAHCGPTPEDIYLKPSSACSPPTARPGASMHERGLAVDFHLAGRSISTRESPGYQWLAANAATFGFHNLPSEPWHWSVNGQ